MKLAFGVLDNSLGRHAGTVAAKVSDEVKACPENIEAAATRLGLEEVGSRGLKVHVKVYEKESKETLIRAAVSDIPCDPEITVAHYCDSLGIP